MQIYKENISLLHATFVYPKKHQVPSLILMVDFIKAFDSVAWSFIEKSFTKFKFGNDIIQWILTVYININSCVHVSRQQSQWFDVKGDTRACTRPTPMSAESRLLVRSILEGSGS